MNRLAAIVLRISRFPAWAVDAALASVVVATMVSERLTTTPSLGARLPAVALAAVIGGSLAFRRRLPVTSYAVGTAAPGYQPGRGLLGIAERVAVFGGAIEHGRGDGGGFRVRAMLPLP